MSGSAGTATPPPPKRDCANGCAHDHATGGIGEAGDQYTALDRFGQLIETLWTTGGTAQVHSKYGRNQIGNVLWRRDEMAHSLGVLTEDNLYGYDGLAQVLQHQRAAKQPSPEARR